jgi:hypothetical protein
MKKLVLAPLLGTALTAAPALAQQTAYGPSPYLSFSDSPFASIMVPGQFYVEDVEDGAINTPGLSVTGSGLCLSATCFAGSGLIDSVGNGGNGNLGNSIWSAGPITVTFDQNALGFLPNAAGLVWTDGADPITFEAFDQNNVSLGTITATDNADNNNSGGTAEDRFFGFTNPGGISSMTISNPGAMEIDHVQYGLVTLAQTVGLPEPSTWAMMLLGFGAVGCALRRKRQLLAV